tara:strand:+ start:258 stop:1055 length:798 start_codon:yes stop_codon:yes gene_type:complete
MSNPFFSVITPTLNSGRTIEKCLESVSLQENSLFEQLIIDGGSEDQTAEICNKYIDSNNLKIYNNKVKGIYKAINEGIKNAKGEFIILLNSDDWLFEKNTLAKAKGVILRNKDLKDIFVFKSKISDGSKYLGSINYNNNYKLPIQKLPFSHGAMIVRKIFFEHNFMYDENYSLSSDLDFLNKVEKEKICFYNQEIHCFSIKGQSSLSFRGIFESRNIALKYGKSNFSTNLDFSKAILNKVLIITLGIKNLILIKSILRIRGIWKL